MSLCQSCGKNTATIQTTQLVDGRPVIVNLCQECLTRLQESTQTTSSLDRFGRDLTQMAREGKLDPVIGRKPQIERVIHILSRRTKNNPVLIGDPGVGKTAIAEGLAQRIADGLIPETLSGKRVVQLDLASMLAGASFRGEFERRLKNTIAEVVSAKGQIILFLDELHTVVGAGAGEGAIDAANMLKPALARGELQCVGATTINEYRRHIERDGALERRFQPVMVPEPTQAETTEILSGLRPRYESHHKVKISDEAIEAAINLSGRYISERFLPDKAIDLIDEAAAKVRLTAVREPETLKQVESELANLKTQLKTLAENGQEKLRSKIAYLEKVRNELTDLWMRTKLEEMPLVGKDDVAQIVSLATGIPIVTLTEAEREKFLKLEERIHSRLVDQEEAVKVVSEALRRSRAGLKDPKRPIGAFMFLGPTGVGKTELTKALAHALYGNDELLVRLDMSEYNERHTVARMVGAPPGYVGYEEGGQLTEIVRRKPFSVILFDEIEKAHPQIYSLLLQIMEDGRLTDGHGRTVDFKNTILIMTSNLGSSLIKKNTLGFTPQGRGESRIKPYEELRNELLAQLKKSFAPEFLNRLDEVVVFKALTPENVRQIVNLQLEKTAVALAIQEIQVEFSESCRNELAKSGFDVELGARPLKRFIQNKIENTLSQKIISLEIKPGDEVVVDFVKDAFIFQTRLPVGLKTRGVKKRA